MKILNQITKNELKENIIKKTLGLDINAKFNILTKVHWKDGHSGKNLDLEFFKCNNINPNNIESLNVDVIQNLQDKFPNLSKFENITFNKEKIENDKHALNLHLSYSNAINENKNYNKNILLFYDSYHYHAKFKNLSINQDIEIPDTDSNTILYILFTDKGTFLYIENNNEDFDYHNFFDTNRITSYNSEFIRCYTESNKEIKETISYIDINLKIESMYSSSTIPREIIKYNNNLIEKYSNSINKIKVEDNKIFIDDNLVDNSTFNNYISDYSKKRNLNTLEAYLFTWVELYNNGVNNLDFIYDDNEEILDSCIYNNTTKDVNYLLTVKNIYQRGISINKSLGNISHSSADFDGDIIPYIYVVNYSDISGIKFHLEFIVGECESDEKILPFLRFIYYNDNNFLYTNEKIASEIIDIDYKNEDNYITMRDRFGIPNYFIQIEK